MSSRSSALLALLILIILIVIAVMWWSNCCCVAACPRENCNSKSTNATSCVTSSPLSSACERSTLSPQSKTPCVGGDNAWDQHVEHMKACGYR